MFGRINRHISTLALTLLVGATLVPAQASAQDGRFRVLVPDLFPTQGADDDFGRDVAKELRELINGAVRHVAIERDEIREGLRALEMNMGDLISGETQDPCVLSRQFAPQINAQVVVCASYVEAANDMIDFQIVQFIGVEGGQTYDVDAFSVRDNAEEEAAQRIYDAFDAFQQLEQDRGNCFYYAGLDQYADALRNCNDVVAANPRDAAVHFQVAQIYRAQEKPAEALEKVERVLELDPINSDALYLGGFMATEVGEETRALDYFRRYLELNQDAAAVRRRIAYELAQESDFQGAMALIEEGMGPDADIGLYEQRGAYAFRLAGEMMQGVPLTDGRQEVPPEVAELYETAIADLTRVYEERGDSTEVGNLRNIINAHLQLGNVQEAVQFGERVVETFPDEARLWVSYAQALGRAERVDQALTAWQEVERLDPDFRGLYERQADLLLKSDRRDDAIPLLQRAVEQGFDATTAARMLFNDAYQKGVQGSPPDYDYAIAGLQAGKRFDADSMTMSMLNFFHGYVRYQQGVALARANEADQSVAVARRALPIFQEAQRLLEQGREYADADENISISQFLSNTADYIEIQELIIERGS